MAFPVSLFHACESHQLTDTQCFPERPEIVLYHPENTVLKSHNCFISLNFESFTAPCESPILIHKPVDFGDDPPT
jgi:hypothetical protein